jgi:hypothetical protein
MPESEAHTNPLVEQILKKSDLIVFEARLDTVYVYPTRPAMECFSPEELDKMKIFLSDSLKLSDPEIDSVLNFEALRFGQYLTQSWFNERLVFFDAIYYRMAKSLDKKIYALDSYTKIVGYQQSALDDLFYRTDSFRASYLKNLDRINSFYNLEKGAAMDSFMRYDEHIKDDRAMVVERNLEWIAPIDSLIRKNKVLIIVGSGHLGGDSGLLNLLKAKKYTVKPI